MERGKSYYVYFVASDSGTLYIGVTGKLSRRIVEHKEKSIPGFSSRYTCTRLVYYERYGDVYAAINREKQLKRWSRAKKQSLIARLNPHWEELEV
jgi:putative endonuclease